MSRRRKRNASDDPSERFRLMFWQAVRNRSRAMVKIERMPQGSMSNHMVTYMRAYEINETELPYVEEVIQGGFGNGVYALEFVDEERRSLREFGRMWIYPTDADDPLDRRESKAEVELLEAALEHTNRRNISAANDTLAIAKSMIELGNMMSKGRR